MTNNLVIESLNEIIKEAKNGYVNFEVGKLYFKFDTVIDKSFSNVTLDHKMPTLNIQNYDELIKLLTEYIEILLKNDIPWSTSVSSDDLKSYIKKQICYLFSNATYYDFNNPNCFVNRYINFLNDKTFDDINLTDGIYIDKFDASVVIRKVPQPGGQETPYAFVITLERIIDGELYSYHLPYVRYGINDIDGEKEAYLYAIQNCPSDNLSAKPHQIKFNKEINRKLYKVNKGVENQELLNLPPSFVLADTIFHALLKKENIDKLYIVKELPEKIYIKEKLYEGQEERIKKLPVRKLQALGIITDVGKLKQNLTERFIKVSDRMSNHLNGMVVQDMDSNSYKVATMDYQDDYINNSLLSEIYDKCSQLRLDKKL